MYMIVYYNKNIEIKFYKYYYISKCFEIILNIFDDKI